MEDVWYSGLRAVERRAVTPDDVPVIGDLRRDRLLRLVLALAGPPLLFALGIVGAFLTGTGEPIVVAGSAAMFFAVALRPWRTVPAFTCQLAALARDLDSGEVLVCRGEGRELLFAFGPEQRLEPAVLVHGSRDQVLEVEVLSESGAILRINGVPLRSWSQTEKGSTAAKSEHARLAAQFVTTHPEHVGVAVGERLLSSEERAELSAHATPLSLVDVALLFALTTLVAKLQADLKEFIALLNSHGVEYVLVGGHAVAYHGHPRYTGNIDFLGRTTVTNAERVLSVLEAFGFGSIGIGKDDLLRPGQVIQLGQPPNRIDILTSISAVDFDSAWQSRVETTIDDLPVSVLGWDDLLRNKRASARKKDLADIEKLLSVAKRKNAG